MGKRAIADGLLLALATLVLNGGAVQKRPPACLEGQAPDWPSRQPAVASTLQNRAASVGVPLL